MKHSENGHLRKIIWTINPFDEAFEIQENLAHVLSQIAKQTDAEIEPLTTVSTWEEVLTPNTVDDYRIIVERELKTFLKKVNILNLLPTKILVREVGSLTQVTKALDKY